MVVMSLTGHGHFYLVRPTEGNFPTGSSPEQARQGEGAARQDLKEV